MLLTFKLEILAVSANKTSCLNLCKGQLTRKRYIYLVLIRPKVWGMTLFDKLRYSGL